MTFAKLTIQSTKRLFEAETLHVLVIVKKQIANAPPHAGIYQSCTVVQQGHLKPHVFPKSSVCLLKHTL